MSNEEEAARGPEARELERATPATIEIESARAVQEVQAAMTIAKRFPRDTAQALDRVLQACCRPVLAEHAIYAYPRGGQTITGPSIRLAEALAQNWGNVQFGIRELSQQTGESTVEAFAWDIETNTRAVKVFQVPHLRYTRERGNVRLTDPRDIYELVANNGARRLRACILAIVPGDVVDAALKKCEATQEHSLGAKDEVVQKMIEAFAVFGVTKERIERRLGHRLDERTVMAEVLNLKRIYTTLKDGLAKADDFFPPAGEPPKSAKDALKERAKGKGKKEEGEPPAGETGQGEQQGLEIY
jgi:hypothetical protein